MKGGGEEWLKSVGGVKPDDFDEPVAVPEVLLDLLYSGSDI